MEGKEVISEKDLVNTKQFINQIKQFRAILDKRGYEINLGAESKGLYLHIEKIREFEFDTMKK